MFFVDTWFLKQDIRKWLKTKICRFYGKFENEKKKDNIFFTFWSKVSKAQISYFPRPWFEFSFDLKEMGWISPAEVKKSTLLKSLAPIWKEYSKTNLFAQIS